MVTKVDPTSLPSNDAPRTPRSLGGTVRSTTGLETFVQGKFVKTYGRGEFSVLIKPILRQLGDRIAELATQAAATREQAKYELAAKAYFELMNLRDAGATEFSVPTTTEFMDLIDSKYSDTFNAKKISTLILEALLGYELTSHEDANLILDLAVHADTIAPREGGSIRDDLPSELSDTFYRNFRDGMIIPAAASEIVSIFGVAIPLPRKASTSLSSAFTKSPNER